MKRFAPFVILTLGALAFFSVRTGLPAVSERGLASGSDRPITEGTFAKGLHYKVYRDGSPVSEADVEDFRIVPRNFFVFRVKSLN